MEGWEFDEQGKKKKNQSTKGLKSLFWVDANHFTFCDSAFLAVLDEFLAGPVGPAGPSRTWQ